MNTGCDVVLDLLSAYASDDLSEQSRELVRAHLETCESCRALLEVLKTPEYDVDIPLPTEEKGKALSRDRILLLISLGAYGLVALVLLIRGLTAVGAENTLRYTLTAFYLALPVTAAACAWLGASGNSLFRWYLPLAFSLVSILLDAVVLHRFSWEVLFFTLIPGIVGMLIGEAIRASKNE